MLMQTSRGENWYFTKKQGNAKFEASWIRHTSRHWWNLEASMFVTQQAAA
jgi:hypothetical protein